MPYSLPNFNLTCDIFTGSNTGYPPSGHQTPARVLGVPCQLGARSRVNLGIGVIPSGSAIPFHLIMQLLLPAGTDVRGYQDSTGKVDFVEVPVGSGRKYWTMWVDDVAKGFANEYRLALLKIPSSLWVAPYP